MKASRRKQTTFRDAKRRFPEKWHLRNHRRNFMLTTCHYPDRSCLCAGNLLQPIRSTILLWLVTCHHFLGSHFAWKPVISTWNVGCFSGNLKGRRLQIVVQLFHRYMFCFLSYLNTRFSPIDLYGHSRLHHPVYSTSSLWTTVKHRISSGDKHDSRLRW